MSIDPIELTEDTAISTTTRKRLPWPIRFFLRLLAVASLVTLLTLFSYGMVSLSERAMDWLSVKSAEAKGYVADYLDILPTVVVKYIEPTDEDTVTLVKNISKEYGINSIITLAMIHQESGERLVSNRLKYEEHLYPRTPKNLDPEVRRMYATSIGLMQVIPMFHLDRCGLGNNYERLFDRATNIRCGLKVLQACLQANHKVADVVGRYRNAWVCYNGSEKYADEVFSRLGRLTLSMGNL